MSPVHISPSTSVQKLERTKQKQGPGVGVLNRILYSRYCGSYRCNTNIHGQRLCINYYYYMER